MVLGLVAHGIWSETAVQAPEPRIEYRPDTTAVSDPADGELLWEGTGGSGRVDRYGNPIETAIGDYRIDQSGEIYERHSPDTAVPRLGVPSA